LYLVVNFVFNKLDAWLVYEAIYKACKQD